jgi:asparagine synthase (glutamine-hydrolysing)
VLKGVYPIWIVTSSLKIKGGNGKHLLKMAARPALPIEILRKKKWGFGVPLAAWFRDPRGMGRHLDILRSLRFRERGYFRPDVVESLIQQHLSGVADHSEIFWVLISLELWHRTFLDPPSPAV